MKHLFIKRLLTIALVLFGTTPLWATWPMYVEDAGLDYLSEITPVGEAGDHYVCGAITPESPDRTMQLSGIRVRGNGGQDILIGRLDPHGNWLWARTVGTVGDDQAPVKILADRAENIYIVGQFQGTLRIGGYSLVGDQPENAFVAKFNHLGHVLWAKRVGDPSQAFAVRDAGLYETPANAENQRVTLYVAAHQNQTSEHSQALLFRYDGETGRHQQTTTASTGVNAEAQSKVRVGRTWVNWLVEFKNEFHLSASNEGISRYNQVGEETDLILVRIEEGSLPGATQITKGYHLPDHQIQAMEINEDGDRALVLSRAINNLRFPTLAHRITANGVGAWDNGEQVYDFGYRTIRGIALEPGGSFRFCATSSVLRNDVITLGRFDSEQRTISQYLNSFVLYTFDVRAMSVDAHGRFTLVGTSDVYRIDHNHDYDLYAVTATPEGVLEPHTVDIGAQVPIPPSAINPTTGDLYRLPIGYYDNLGNPVDTTFQTAVVNGQTQVLALAPGMYTIEWAGRNYGQQIPGSNPPRFIDSGLKQTISVRFPSNPRLHISGTPIDLNPVAQEGAQPEYEYHSVVYRHATTPEPENGIFTPTATGENNPNDAYSVILYARDNQVAKAVVLRTIHWWQAPTLTQVTAEIGQPIVASTHHTDPSGRTGYVLNPASPFDGAGDRPAHQRTARQGPIIPVNDGNHNRGEPVHINNQPVFYPNTQNQRIHHNDLVVVYYAYDESVGVSWPQHPVLVQPTWPTGTHYRQAVSQTGGLPTQRDLPDNDNIGAFHLVENGTFAWFATDTHTLHSQAGPQAEPSTLAQATGSTGDLHVAPDGTTIAWTDPDAKAVYLTQADGSGQHRLDQPGVFEDPNTITGFGDYYFLSDPHNRTIVRLHRNGNGRADSTSFAGFVNFFLNGQYFQVPYADTHDNPDTLNQQDARTLLGNFGPSVAIVVTMMSRRATDTFTNAWDPAALRTRFANWTDGNLENEEISSISFSNDSDGNGRLTWHLDTPAGPQTEQALFDGTVVHFDQVDVQPATLTAGPNHLFWVDKETNRIVSNPRNTTTVNIEQERGDFPVVSLAQDDSGQRLYWLELTGDGMGRLMTAPYSGEPEVLAADLSDPAYLQRVGDELTWRTTTRRQIIIASEQGSEFGNQPRLDPNLFPEYHIYHQTDRTLPGFNPNNEHAALFNSNRGTGYQAVFALRSDLTDVSEPYVLLKYRDPTTDAWAFQVYQVRTRGAGFDFTYVDEAGRRLYPPYPLKELTACSSTLPTAPWDAPYWRDHKNHEWSIAAGNLARGYYYPLRDSFYWDADQPDHYTGLIDGCAPWLDGIADDLGNPPSRGTPLTCHYRFNWPEHLPILQPGETLIHPKNELPEIFNQAATQVVYERRDGQTVDEPFSLVRLFRPLEPISIPLADENLTTLPDDVKTQTTGQYTRILGNQSGTITIPFSLRQRLNFSNQALHFSGILETESAGEPLLLVNVMTSKEADLLKSISQDGNFHQLIDALYERTRNPNNVDPDSVPEALRASQYYVGMSDEAGYLEPVALLGDRAVLTAGKATGTGYVTLMFNNHESLGGAPVDVAIIRVGCLPINENRSTPYVGQVKVIESGNPFDEQITLRHSGDFGGAPDHLAFQWLRSSAAPDGSAPEPPTFDEDGTIVDWKSWHEYNPPTGTPPLARIPTTPVVVRWKSRCATTAPRFSPTVTSWFGTKTCRAATIRTVIPKLRVPRADRSSTRKQPWRRVGSNES